MRRIRLHVPAVLRAGQAVALPEDSAHYARHVLRLAPGERLQVFDGAGAEFEAELLAQGKRGLAVVPLASLEPMPESPLAVHLGIGLARGERMDWALQKATELGVAAITPLALERCTAKVVGEREDNRLRHWRQVVASACEQCGRAVVPRVAPAATLDAWLAEDAGIPGIVLHTRAAAGLEARDAPRALRVLIGPEGGLTETEFGQATRAGFAPVSLGPRVLRAETAPLALLAIVQYLWGDLRGAS
jgi:16S rRNA (uracil1498-N3)-methyltransferase